MSSHRHEYLGPVAMSRKIGRQQFKGADLAVLNVVPVAVYVVPLEVAAENTPGENTARRRRGNDRHACDVDFGVPT